MKNKFTILGCGSSLGAPWITNYWGSCDKKNYKNIRSRCSAHIQYKNLSSLLFSSSIEKTLERGFAIVKRNSEIITRRKTLKDKDLVKIKFYDDAVIAKIKKT